MEETPLRVPAEIYENLSEESTDIFAGIYVSQIDKKHALSKKEYEIILQSIGTPNLDDLSKKIVDYVTRTSLKTSKEHVELMRVSKEMPEDLQTLVLEEIEQRGKEPFIASILEKGEYELLSAFKTEIPPETYKHVLEAANQTDRFSMLFQMINDYTRSLPNELIDVAKTFIISEKDNLINQKLNEGAHPPFFTKLDSIIPLEQNDFEKIIEKLISLTSVYSILSFQEHFPNHPKMTKAVIANQDALYEKALSYQAVEGLRLYHYLESVAPEPDWNRIGMNVAKKLSIVDIAQLPEETATKVMAHIPWGESLERLKNIQRISKRHEHCPWRNELVPLVKVAQNEGFISIENTADGELLVDFVQKFGAYNIPSIFELFVSIKQTRRVEDLSIKHKDWIRDALGEQALEKAQNSEALLNALGKFKRDIQSDILKDEIPKNIETKLGQEIFNAIRGTTKWGRSNEFEQILSTWRETQTTSPEKTKLKEGYTEKTFQISAVRDTELSFEEQLTIKKTLVENKELILSVRRIIDTYKRGIDTPDLSVWWKEKQQTLIRKWQENLERVRDRQSEATSDVARKSMQKNIDRLQMQIENVSMLSFSNTEKDDKNLVECMEQIHALHIDELDPLLFELSAMHLDKVAIGDWADSIREMTKDTDLITPDHVDKVAQFLEQYVHEHYLNKNQVDHDHTQHVPFSKELTESLRSVWGLKGDVRKNPIVQTGEKLRAIDKG